MHPRTQVSMETHKTQVSELGYGLFKPIRSRNILCCSEKYSAACTNPVSVDPGASVRGPNVSDKGEVL